MRPFDGGCPSTSLRDQAETSLRDQAETSLRDRRREECRTEFSAADCKACLIRCPHACNKPPISSSASLRLRDSALHSPPRPGRNQRKDAKAQSRKEERRSPYPRRMRPKSSSHAACKLRPDLQYSPPRRSLSVVSASLDHRRRAAPLRLCVIFPSAPVPERSRRAAPLRCFPLSDSRTHNGHGASHITQRFQCEK